MAKTIFGTTEKSNFILNMDLDWYRRFCGKLLLIVLWATALSQGINQLTEAANASLNETVREGGAGMIFALILVALRSVATVFSIGGVLVLIFTVVGLMRQQWTKGTAVPYCILTVSLLWAVGSMMRSYDYSTSVFGQDGRDEGWLALLMYAGMFFLGTMLRRSENQTRFLRGIMIIGIVQCLWGFMQAMPVFDYANPNKGLNSFRNIDPLLLWNLRLPAGMTDSPVTFAMLLAMLLAVSIPAALLAQENKTRITAAVCGALSMLLVFRTQTVAGLIAGCGAVLLLVLLLIVRFKAIPARRKAAIPAVLLAAAALSVGWVCITPSMNRSYYRPDKVSVKEPEDGLTVNAWETDNGDATLANGLFLPDLNEDVKGKKLLRLYDGGIIWDDGYYRLSTAGPYVRNTDYNIYDAFSALRYCREKGWKAVKIDPLFGVGPDNFHFTQLRTSMIVSQNQNLADRPYNDFIFIAATRGIPSLILHIALLIACLILAWRHRKQMQQSWVLLAAGAGVVLYCATAAVGISVLTVAPFFWILLGILAGAPVTEPVKETANETANETAKEAADETADEPVMETPKEPAPAQDAKDAENAQDAKPPKSKKKQKSKHKK